MINQIYATKMSMSQLFVDGKRTPVTLLKVPVHTVIGECTLEKNGYRANIMGLGKKKKSPNKSVLGLLKKNKISIFPKYIREFHVDETTDLKIGDTLNLSDILTVDSLVNATGRSKGKGFTGTIKRWNFAAQPRTHGQSDRRRAPGSIGRGTTPGRVLPGKKMAGRHGNKLINVANLKIISYEPKTSKLIISGAVPGARNSLIKLTIHNKKNA